MGGTKSPSMATLHVVEVQRFSSVAVVVHGCAGWGRGAKAMLVGRRNFQNRCYQGRTTMRPKASITWDSIPRIQSTPIDSLDTTLKDGPSTAFISAIAGCSFSPPPHLR